MARSPTRWTTQHQDPAAAQADTEIDVVEATCRSRRGTVMRIQRLNSS